MSLIKGLPKHNQKFYEITSVGFYHTFQDCSHCLREKKEREYITYYIVRPCYVYSLNQEYDWRWNFDVGPVNFGLKKNKGASWRVRYSVEINEIGKKIFRHEWQAIEAFNKRFKPEERERFKKLEEIHKSGEDTAISSCLIHSGV